MDLIPFHSDHVFLLFLKLYIFCTKMSVLSVLSYIYTYGRKKIKKAWSRKQKKFFIYINTNHTTFPTFPTFLYIFCTILQYLLVLQYVYIHVEKIKKKHGAEKQKNLFIYINTKNTAKLAFTAKLYIF